MDKRDNPNNKNKNRNSGFDRDYSRFENPPSYYRGDKNYVPEEKNPPPQRPNPQPKKQQQKQKPKKKSGKVVSIDSRKKRKGAVVVNSNAARSELVVLTICLIMFMISVGGSFIKFVTKEKVATMVVPHGNVDIPRVINGIIVRDETLYYSQADGEVVYNVADMEKVKKGSMVCSIENPESTNNLQAQSEQLSQKIIEMQNLRGDISAVSSEVSVINNKIKAEIDANMLKLNSNETAALYNLKDSLNKNIKLRNDKLLNENGGVVKSFVEEYRQNAGKIEESRAPIIAGEGGIVSYSVDGYEDKLNLDNISEITKEQTVMNVGEDSFTKNKTVKSEDVVFKIIESNNWYIAAYIENDLIYEWSENGTVKLYLEKDGEYVEHNFKVASIRKGETESFVTLRSDRQMLDFLNMRTIAFKTFDSVYSGIKIPESAICTRTFLEIPESFVSEYENNPIVYKKNGDTVEKVKINAKTLRNTEAKEGHVYILQDFDNIRRGDTILMNPTSDKTYTINDIVNSEGVFRTNNSLATFVSINTDGMVRGNKGYVILNAENNSGGIKFYDRIVTDTATYFVKEGDIIN